MGSGGPAWGEGRVCTDMGPNPGCPPPAPPPRRQAPGGAGAGAHGQQILDFLPPPTPPLSPSSGSSKGQARHLAREVGRAGGGGHRPRDFRGQEPGFAVLGQRSRRQAP